METVENSTSPTALGTPHMARGQVYFSAAAQVIQEGVVYQVTAGYCSILLTWHRCIISRLVHKIFLHSVDFPYLLKFYRNFASTNADKEPFCTALLASQLAFIAEFTTKRSWVRVHVCSFFYLYSNRLISFIIDVPRSLRNEILDHSISKGWCVTRKMSQSFQNIFRDSYENIVLYYRQDIRVKIILYTCCLSLSSVEKCLKKSMRQVLALRQSRYLLNICDYFKNMSKAQRFNFTYRVYGKRSRWGSYKNNNNKCKYR